jgi:hypothetical protein
MERQDFVKTVVVGLMAIVFIIPSLAGAAEKSKKQVPVPEAFMATIGSEVINQEVFQILRKGNNGLVTLNIAGQPGVYFKIQYSNTGAEGSYALVPKGTGVIRGNGFGTVSFDLRKLGKEEVYLKVTTADTKDFANPRMTPKPLRLAAEQVKIKDRGAYEDLERISKHGGRTNGSPCFVGPRGEGCN